MRSVSWNEVAGWAMILVIASACGLAPLKTFAQLRTDLSLPTKTERNRVNGTGSESNTLDHSRAFGHYENGIVGVCELSSRQGCTLDERLLFGLATSNGPRIATVTMTASRRLSLPLFVAAAPVAYSLFSTASDDADLFAYQVLLSEATAAAIVFVGKNVIKRARPFANYPALVDRAGAKLLKKSYSMPSGHSAIAFSIATSVALSGAGPGVVVPLFLWAGITATGRIWFAMHYPSDVVAGAVVGILSAVLVHGLGERVVPKTFRASESIPASLVLARVTF